MKAITKLILIIMLLSWGCMSPLKMRNSPYGSIYKFQEKQIKESRNVEAMRPIKLPLYGKT